MSKTQLTKNTTTGNWELTETNQGQHYTNTLETAGKAVDGDIKIDITAKSGSASVNNSSITPTFDRSGNVITVTGSTTTTGSATAGWVSSVTSGTSSISSTNNVNKYTIPSASTFSLAITNKASTNLTVGTLSSGYYPFTTSLTGTLSASTGGYFTSGSATDSSVTVGRLPATAYGSETTTQPSTTTYPLAKTVTPHPTNTKYFTVGAGYNPNQQIKINPMSSGTAAVPSASVSSYTAPSVAVSGTATGFTPSSSATSYYVTVNGAVPSGGEGSVKAKYTNSTAGYAPKNTTGTESSATTITPTVTGGGDKIYIPSGSAGTPIATKGTVSSNSITVTPSVTNTEGYIPGGTKTGTGVTVNASELVSENKELTQQTGTNVTNYETASVRSATASMPSSLSGTSATAELNGTTITLIKKVTNSANFTQSGWLSSLSGTTTLTLEGEVLTEPTITVTPSNETQTITPSSGKLLSSVIVNAAPTYKKVEVEASSSQIYKIIGECTIIPLNLSEGTGTTISNTYFKITSISTSYVTSGIYETTVTYQTMANSSSSSSPNWNSFTVTTQGTLSSVSKCLISFELGQAVISKCSSTPTKISSISYTTVTSGTSTYTLIYDIDVKKELCYYELYVSCDSASSYKCLFYPYFGIAGAVNYKPTGSYAKSSMAINYRYSTNGTSYSNGSCSTTASNSGQITGSYSIFACYYPTTEYL